MKNSGWKEHSRKFMKLRKCKVGKWLEAFDHLQKNRIIYTSE